jgi:hypothetical protein
MRGYVLERDEDEEDSESDLKAEIREQMIAKLAGEWNIIHRQIEERSWRSREERYEEADYLAGLADDYACHKVDQALEANPNLTESEQAELRQQVEDEFYQDQKKKENEIYLRKQVVEELLSELGARMARPYEHWNEEEKYIEYMETRYDSYDDY